MAAALSPREKQALLDFHSAVGGLSCIAGWPLSTDPCTGAWKGIICNDANTTVLQMGWDHKVCGARAERGCHCHGVCACCCARVWLRVCVNVSLRVCLHLFACVYL